MLKGLLKFIVLSFTLSCLFIFSNSSLALTPEQTCTTSISSGGVCPAGQTCAMLPKCKSDCGTGCQPGYYLSDGDANPANNMSGGTLKINGVCEICPPGFYCPGNMKDKIACPSGTYNPQPGSISSTSCITPNTGYCVARGDISYVVLLLLMFQIIVLIVLLYRILLLVFIPLNLIFLDILKELILIKLLMLK